MAASGWLTSEEAARKLGVKAETLYAYVSRGLLRSEREPGGRRSRYLRADVERLAARSRSGAGRAGGLEIIVETRLTHLDPNGGLSYRGWDVADASATSSFEEVAAWLWTGARQAVPFEAPAALLGAAAPLRALIEHLPALDGLRAVVSAIRSADPLRDDRRAESVAATGRGLVATLLEVLPLRGDPAVGAGDPAAATVAERLWPRLTAAPPEARHVQILDATLILLADHELAASALAARVAASTWADPYLVVLAGLAVLGGPLHGGASSEARALIREVATGGISAAEAINDRLRDGRRIPGFGHSVYLHGDPRGRVLSALLEDEGPVSVQAAAHDLETTMSGRGLPSPNVDFATARLAESFDMIPGASEVVFAFARIVGWLAHAIEEYEHRMRFRPRAVYIGPSPITTPPAT